MEIIAKRDKKPLITSLVIAIVTFFCSYNVIGLKNAPNFGTAFYLIGGVMLVVTALMAVGCIIFILNNRAMVSREGDKLLLTVGWRQEEISIADIISVEGDDPKDDPIRLQSGSLSFKVRAADGERIIFVSGVLDAKVAEAAIMKLMADYDAQDNAKE